MRGSVVANIEVPLGKPFLIDLKCRNFNFETKFASTTTTTDLQNAIDIVRYWSSVVDGNVWNSTVPSWRLV